MSRAAQGQFSRWRVEVLENAGAPVTGPSHVARTTTRREFQRVHPRMPPSPRAPPRGQQPYPAVQEFIFRPRNPGVAGRPVNQDRNVIPVQVERPLAPQQGGQVQRPAPPTIDNDWLREVDQAFGGITDMHRLQMENLQVLQVQTGPPRLQRQQLSEAQQQLQHLHAQVQPPQQRVAAPPHVRLTGVGDQTMTRAEEAQHAAVRRMLEWEENRLGGRRRSAPTPTNVSATGGEAARNPLPS